VPVGIGPFNGPAPNTTVQINAAVLTEQFDSAVTSNSGDLIAIESGSSASAYAPLTLAPGQSGTIMATIVPNQPHGTVVNGHLYVDTLALDPNSGALLTGAGDELAAIPYSYTVK